MNGIQLQTRHDLITEQSVNYL